MNVICRAVMNVICNIMSGMTLSLMLNVMDVITFIKRELYVICDYLLLQ